LNDSLEFAQNNRVLLLRYDPGNIDIDVSLGAFPLAEEIIERST